MIDNILSLIKLLTSVLTLLPSHITWLLHHGKNKRAQTYFSLFNWQLSIDKRKIIISQHAHRQHSTCENDLNNPIYIWQMLHVITVDQDRVRWIPLHTYIHLIYSEVQTIKIYTMFWGSTRVKYHRMNRKINKNHIFIT